MANKKTSPEVAPKQVDLRKKAELESRIQVLAKERNEVADEIASLAQSENDISEIPSQVLFNLYGKRSSIERQMAELLHEITTNCFIEEGETSVGIDEVNVGSIITVRCEFDVDDVEVLTKKLVTSNPNPYAPVEEISIESPLGRAVHKRKVGETVQVQVNSTFTYPAIILKKE